MNRPVNRIKSRALQDSPPPPPPPSPTKPLPPAPPGTDALALAELKNAAVTYDFLRKRGDPTQFWEMLRLARSRRAIEAPGEGEPFVPPAPEIEASIVTEVDFIRRQHGQLVKDLRKFLTQVQGLPEPAERLEMALAFLLAATREHQAVAKWVAEPEKHGSRAAEKLRSLAAITDPYREALRPWVLETSGATDAKPAAPAAAQKRGGTRMRARPAPSASYSDTVNTIRLASRCREILSGVYLDADLWEALLLATSQPEPTRAALDRIEAHSEKEQLEELEAEAEVLFKKVAALRSEHGHWVQPLKEALLREKATPQDPVLFEIALGLTVVAPGVSEWAPLWLQDPVAHGQEAVDQWTRAIARAEACRSAMNRK
jgi:hypothetical protein